jgi:hypothetical protein
LPWEREHGYRYHQSDLAHDRQPPKPATESPR